MESLNRLYQQLDRVEQTMERLVPELAAIKTDLAYHIKRSDILEEKHAVLEKQYDRLHGFFLISGWLVAFLVSVFSALHFLKIL